MKIIAIEESVFEILMKRIEALENSLCETSEAHVEKSYFTSKQVMEILGVGSTTLQNYRDNGKLSFYKVGNTIRYRYPDIHDFINNQK